MPASKNKLRITCGEIITKSGLKKASKLQLLKFVKEEANIHQIKGFLLDGEIKTSLDEADEIAIDVKFKDCKFGK